MLLPLQFIPGIKGILDEEEIEVRLKSSNEKCDDPELLLPAIYDFLDVDLFSIVMKINTFSVNSA